MKIRRLVSFICGLIFSMGANASPLSNQNDEQLFKSFALSSCLAKYYKGSDIADDALTAMQGYREFSDLPLDVFFDVSTLLESEVGTSYIAKDGRAIELAYCIDFLNSEKLHSLYLEAIKPE